MIIIISIVFGYVCELSLYRRYVLYNNIQLFVVSILRVKNADVIIRNVQDSNGWGE